MTEGPLARVAQGLLRGANAAGEVAVYRGIPYAKPPVGALRWRLPQPAEPWEGERPAAAFGPTAPQPEFLASSLYAGGHEHTSEDCLYLNVWTAAADPSERRPVLVFVHLGGSQAGGGSLSSYDGEALARRGLVVVTLNHRLGRLGYMAHPALSAESEHGASGNYGLHDQVAALRWVQENIAAFGGDPGCIAYGGISAGSQAVSILMSSPLARGLFQRGIGESGAMLGPVASSTNACETIQDLEHAERAGALVGEALGACTADDLRALSVPDLMAAEIPVVGETAWWHPGADGEFRRGGFDSMFPIVDGHLLPESPFAVHRRGDEMAIPLLTGSSATEGTGCPHMTTVAGFEAEAHAMFGVRAQEYLALYPATDENVTHVSAAAFADPVFAYKNWTWARLHSAVAPTFYYHFDREPPVPAGAVLEHEPGAFHGAELPYVFDHLDIHDWPWTDAERRLSDAMASAWVRFATTGDPGWPAFDADAQEVMGFGQEIGMRAVPRPEHLAFWHERFGFDRDGPGR